MRHVDALSVVVLMIVAVSMATCASVCEFDGTVLAHEPMTRVLVLVNGKRVHHGQMNATHVRCDADLAREEKLAIYSVEGQRAKHLWHGSANALRCVRDHEHPVPLERSTAGNASGAPRVSILYEGWHAYATQTVLNQSFAPISVEAVIRSNGGLTLGDIYRPPMSAALAEGFYYHAIPEGGPYCIYRKRAGETNPPLPDCANISQTCTRHANMLVSSGVDYVIVDATNLPSFMPFADAIQLRPAQVLAEEWSALRQGGVTTPAIAIWSCVPTGANLYQYYLDSMYNNANLTDLIARDPATGKMLYFIVENPTLMPDETIISLIESNGGRNNILTVRMWANFASSKYSTGLWGFFSPCTGAGFYTTSIGVTCDQYVTTNSPLGTAVSVSPSYQLGYGSIPWGAPGKQFVGTFQEQFATAMASGAANLMISSFNEFLAQPQANNFGSQYVNSMGLEWDPSKSELWVDTFGCSISRDIEPTEECGDAVLRTMQSCLRVWSVSKYLQEQFGNNATGCSAVLGEDECCTKAPESQRILVWALRSNDGNDFLLSNSPAEVTKCVESWGWTEICSYIGGVTDFCVDSSVATTPWAVSGPFYLAATGGVTLYRCRTTAASPTHFFSTDSTCEGQVMEYVLGQVPQTRSSEFPRSLRRCYVPTSGLHYHSLDFPCQAGHVETLYGYVH